MNVGRSFQRRLRKRSSTYKVEDSKRGAYRGRGASLEWRRVRRSRRYRIRKLGEDGWARISSLLREHNLLRLQSVHEGTTEEGEMETTAKD